MAGPWEKYQQNAPAASNKPWEKYSAPKEQEPQDGMIGNFVEGAEDIGKGILENVVMPVVAPIGRAVDRFAGAPTRAALGASQKGENPISAFKNQFGADPELAPTGKEISQKAGLGETSVSDVIPSLYSQSGKEWTKFKRGGLLDPTASGAAGLGVDIIADPTNLIPFGAVAKQAGKLAKPAMKVVGGLIEGGSKLSDVATGTTLATKAIEKVGDASKAIKAQLSPSFIPSYEKNVVTASKLGIKPDELLESTKRGKLSVPSRLERSIGEGPMGQKILDNFVNNSTKIEEGIDKSLMKVGSNKIMDPLEAGEALKQVYSNQLKKTLEGADITYKTAADLTPAMQVTEKGAQELQSMIGGLKKRAKGYKDGATAAQKAIGRDLEQLAMSLERKGTNYRQLSQQIRYIGEAAHDTGLDRAHAKELRDVYKKMSNVLINTVSDIHPDLGAQLKSNNKIMSEFFKSRDALGGSIQSSKTNPESLFKNLTMDANKIAELKKIMPPEDFNAFRGSYLNSLIKRNSDGILYETSLQSIKKNAGRLGRMFDPKEVKEITDYLELGASQGSPIHPGSGGGRIFKDIKEGVMSGFVNKKVLEQINSKTGLLSDTAKESTGLIKPDGVKEAIVGIEKPKGLLKNLPKRGPIEKRLKGAQSIAPSQYREEE